MSRRTVRRADICAELRKRPGVTRRVVHPIAHHVLLEPGLGARDGLHGTRCRVGCRGARDAGTGVFAAPEAGVGQALQGFAPAAVLLWVRHGVEHDVLTEEDTNRQTQRRIKN